LAYVKRFQECPVIQTMKIRPRTEPAKGLKSVGVVAGGREKSFSILTLDLRQENSGLNNPEFEI
jgi:hypothetical protein